MLKFWGKAIMSTWNSMQGSLDWNPCGQKGTSVSLYPCFKREYLSHPSSIRKWCFHKNVNNQHAHTGAITVFLHLFKLNNILWKFFAVTYNFFFVKDNLRGLRIALKENLSGSRGKRETVEEKGRRYPLRKESKIHSVLPLAAFNVKVLDDEGMDFWCWVR